MPIPPKDNRKRRALSLTNLKKLRHSELINNFKIHRSVSNEMNENTTNLIKQEDDLEKNKQNFVRNKKKHVNSFVKFFSYI
jgi:hypothetical protein